MLTGPANIKKNTTRELTGLEK
jgi:hypothetical protein